MPRVYVSGPLQLSLDDGVTLRYRGAVVPTDQVSVAPDLVCFRAAMPGATQFVLDRTPRGLSGTASEGVHLTRLVWREKNLDPK